MNSKRTSRRNLLQATASLAVLGSLSGCGETSDRGRTTDGTRTTDETETETDSAPGRLGYVPEGATVAADVKVDALLTETDLQATLDEWLSQSLQGPRSVADALDSFEQSAGFDLRDVSELLLFGSVEPPETGGVVWADLSEREFRSILTENEFAETDAYEGKRFFEKTSAESDESALAVLDDGVYAVGTKPVVKDVVDVRAGTADAVGGEVREQYLAAPSGYVRAGFEVSDAVVSAVNSAAGSRQTMDVVKSIEAGHTSVHERDGEVDFEFVVHTDSPAAADDLASMVDGTLAFVSRESDLDERDSESVQQLVTVLENTDVEQDGSTVTVSNHYGIETLLVTVAVVSSFVLGLGDSTEPPPTAAFTFDYDSQADTLTITHEGGDTIARKNLALRGTGFTDVSGVDQTQPGSWRGSASGTQSGQPAVVAGDSVTVGVSSDYDIGVLYESESESEAVTLASNFGSDA